MKNSKKLKTDKLFKDFGKKKWLISCEDRYLEDLLTILEAHKIKWFDEKQITPKETAKQLKQYKNYIFEIKRKNKQNYLQYNPREYYPIYHYQTFTFNEFYDLYRDANIQDSEKLIDIIFDETKQSR